MKDMRKNITLYIQGVNYLSSNITLFQWVINLGYWVVNAKPNYKVSHPDWLKKRNTHSEDIVSVEWKADLNPLSKIHAVRELKKAIEEYSSDYNIILVGTSLGGLIAMDAVREMSGDKVSNLILVGSINKSKYVKLDGIKVLNIYSTKDKLARLAIRVLHPIHGSQKLEGENVVNIHIAGIRHDQMFKDYKASAGVYMGKTIGEAIYEETRS